MQCMSSIYPPLPKKIGFRSAQQIFYLSVWNPSSYRTLVLFHLFSWSSALQTQKSNHSKLGWLLLVFLKCSYLVLKLLLRHLRQDMSSFFLRNHLQIFFSKNKSLIVLCTGCWARGRWRWWTEKEEKRGRKKRKKERNG